MNPSSETTAPMIVLPIVFPSRRVSLLVRQDADHDAVRIADEEATDAPRLVDRTVDHLMPGPDRLGVCRIDTA